MNYINFFLMGCRYPSYYPILIFNNDINVINHDYYFKYIKSKHKYKYKDKYNYYFLNYT